MWSESAIISPYSSTQGVDPSSRRLITAGVLSLIVHLVFSLVASSRLFLPTPAPHVDRVKVSLRSPAPVVKPVVAPPSDTKESPQPPADASRISDKNTVVEHETIKHGDNGGPPAQPVKQQSKPSTPKPKPQKAVEKRAEEPKKAPMEAKLFLDNNFVVPVKSRTATSQKSNKEELRSQSLRAMQPFSRAQQSTPGLSVGSSGVPDYMPGIADGAVTMLNAKADQYATFVRRVALQVFGSLRKSSWAELSYGGITQIKDFSTVEGIMSPDGKYIDARMMERSGSDSFDTILLNAVKKSLSDQNPSKGALASDGNYHFVFQSRTWARPSPRGGDERWLLLGTGLL